MFLKPANSAALLSLPWATRSISLFSEKTTGRPITTSGTSRPTQASPFSFSRLNRMAMRSSNSYFLPLIIVYSKRVLGRNDLIDCRNLPSPPFSIYRAMASWRVIHRLAPDISVRHWTVATAAGAGVAWLLGMIPSTVMSLLQADEPASATPVEPPAWLQYGAAVAM